MQKSATGAGFRAPDVVLGRVLKGLPQESTTLVEGTVDSGDAFRTRMMAAYMGEVVAERAVIGLGTTGSYLTARDDPFFKPRTPWTYVLGYGRPVAATHRRPVWADPPYVLTAAPAIDITTWGHAWGATEVDGSTPFVWLSGPGEVLIANRSDRKRTVILQADLLSAGQRRLAVFRANGKIVSRNTVGTSRPVAAQARIVLKADSVTSVLVSAVPATLVRVGTDQRLLMMRVGNLRISPVTGSP